MESKFEISVEKDTFLLSY